jgi:hypothetical protein
VAGFTAFYDADVLYPTELRSLLTKNERLTRCIVDPIGMPDNGSI